MNQDINLVSGCQVHIVLTVAWVPIPGDRGSVKMCQLDGETRGGDEMNSELNLRGLELELRGLTLN